MDMKLLVMMYELYKDKEENLLIKRKVEDILKGYDYSCYLVPSDRDNNIALSSKMLKIIKETECDIIIVITDDLYISELPKLIEGILINNADIAILAEKTRTRSIEWITMFFPRLRVAKAPVSSPSYAFRRSVLTDNIKGIDFEGMPLLLLELLINGNYENLTVIEVYPPARYKSLPTLEALYLALRFLMLLVEIYILHLKLKLIQAQMTHQEKSKMKKYIESTESPPNN